MHVFRMAWRNVWRNRRRTLVTVAAMTLALLVMILYAGLMEGYLEGMERSVLDLEVGDLQVFSADYRNNPSIYTWIDEPGALLGQLDEAGFPASSRLLAFGIAAAADGDASAGVSFRGVDPDRDARVSLIHQHVARGQWLDPADPRGVVLGRRLARTLGVEPGDGLIVLTQAADGSLANDLYRIRGVLRGIGDATDRTGLFMTAGAFRELLVVPDGVHQIIVRRPADLDLDLAAGRVSRLAAELDVQTWRQLLPTVASMMDSARGVMVVMFFIVYVAIGILILNAMLMAVFERVREFGVLKALGVGPFDVLRLIAAESAIQTGIAILVAVSLAVPGVLYLSRTGIDMGRLGGISVMGIAMDPVWRATVNGGIFLRPTAALVLIVTAAVLYPAIKAAVLRPVDAIRHH